jgi:hypothetical protein
MTIWAFSKVAICVLKEKNYALAPLRENLLAKAQRRS